MNQFYDPGMVDKEYIMKGNSAILKCLIPSFVADFVYVEAWIDEEGIEIVASDNNDLSNKSMRNQITISRSQFS